MNKQLTSHDGYKEADKFDAQINLAINNNPINKENARFWLAYARTIKTTCELIESRAKNALED